MAIQNRRGVYADFDPTKLMPGEFAVVMEDDPAGTSGAAVYMCFGNSIVKRLIGADDLQVILDAMVIDWNDIANKPTVFPTNWETITGKPLNFSTTWELVSSKPQINKGTGDYSILANAASVASGANSFAEGSGTTASGANSHAEGTGNTSSAHSAHSEGFQTEASSQSAHAEGYQTTASGHSAHAQNVNTEASGSYSDASGYHTVANHRSQVVLGEYNVPDPSTAAATAKGNYIEIVGNGTSSSNKKNARTLDWSGNEVLAGKLTVGAAPTANMDVTTKQYVDGAISGASVTYTDTNHDGNIVISSGT